ncbi:hypothetical protein A5630_23035 [Mycolicibacterium mucogenicum]|uniref:Uncharacterized protein n=1 Tax=Mycolicibacterium mucogenicum TaxID=56689 RepID=A0A1A3H0Z8_MYCMU|nr:hypothetical protein [Mycolicibacterium mucogenicum]OBJ41318.1 hypothetical protein A5630_23035 [Mycolicibacterium mucogenicum]
MSPWDINEDGELSELESKVPSPAVVRGILFALANLAGLVAGHELLDPRILEQVIACYSLIGPVVLGYWIHKATK